MKKILDLQAPMELTSRALASTGGHSKDHPEDFSSYYTKGRGL